MKNKKIVRQFQKHIIITLAMIAVLAVITVFGISRRRTRILPNDSELFIDVTSAFADGTSTTETYRMEMTEADGSQKFQKENHVLDGASQETESQETEDEEVKLVAVYTIDGEQAEDVLLLDPSAVQTGTTLSVSNIQNGFAKLSEQEQRTYTILGYLSVPLPVMYALLGVIISCYIFYRIYMKEPIEKLEAATQKISSRNLDFKLTSTSKNELGRLCDSFEQMREALVLTNQEMIQMMEERKRLQSSVAHDLRNPIAIMKGYLEMLEEDPKEPFHQEIKTLSQTVERMENYVDSVNEIHKLEDMEPDRKEVVLSECIPGWERDLQVLAAGSGIDLVFYNHYLDPACGEEVWNMDSHAILRVLENVVGNSLRYADKCIEVTVDSKSDQTGHKELVFEIQDDGPGYPQKLLKNPDLYFFTTDQKSGHMGMGMTICRLICRKHQGSIVLSNSPEGGARTVITIGCKD